jgi:peptidoglycan/LPS O-acetylase OafA/YrhL
VSARSIDGVHWADLDGLRALAILLVLGRHSLRPFISEDAYQPIVATASFDLTPLLLNGWIGVDLFFVLSGFLIGRQAWRGDSLRRFWFKRVTRILPAYLACLAVIAIGVTIAGAWSASGGHFLAHLVMLQDYTGSVFVPAFWSLGAEEKFYLLAPLFVVGLARGPSTGSGQAAVRVWQAGGLLALWLCPVIWRAVTASSLTDVVTYAAYFPQYRSPFHLTCESLVLGFAIAWLSLQSWSRGVSRPIREGLFWIGAAGVSYWLVSSLILGHIDARTIVLAPALIGLCFGAMVLAVVLGSGSYSVVLGWGRWRPLATGSYTLYLTHMMVLPMAGVFAAFTPLAPGASIAARWLAFVPWYLVLSAASAYLLHRFVERPVLMWRERHLGVTPRSPAEAEIVRAA